jgi:hypothetical protein
MLILRDEPRWSRVGNKEDAQTLSEEPADDETSVGQPEGVSLRGQQGRGA